MLGVRAGRRRRHAVVHTGATVAVRVCRRQADGRRGQGRSLDDAAAPPRGRDAGATAAARFVDRPAARCSGLESGATGSCWPPGRCTRAARAAWTADDVVPVAQALATAGPDGAPMTHGDLAPWNLVRTADRPVLLDWEFARFADEPLHDLAHFVVQGGALLGSLRTGSRRWPCCASKGSPGSQLLRARGLDSPRRGRCWPTTSPRPNHRTSVPFVFASRCCAWSRHDSPRARRAGPPGSRLDELGHR